MKTIHLATKEDRKLLQEQTYVHITPLNYIKELIKTNKLPNHNYFPQNGFPLHNIISPNTALLPGQIGIRGLIEEIQGKEMVERLPIGRFPIKIDELQKGQKIIDYVLKHKMNLTDYQALQFQKDAIDNNYAWVYVNPKLTKGQIAETIYLDRTYIDAKDIIMIVPPTEKARKNIEEFF